MFNKQLRYFLSAATLAIVSILTTVPVPASAIVWPVTCPPRVSPSTRAAINRAVNTYAVTVQQFTMNPTIAPHRIVVLNGYALVDWVAGESGGEAGLQFSGGTWKVLRMAGGSGIDLARHGAPGLTALRLRSLLSACEQGHYSANCTKNGACTQQTQQSPPR